MILLFIFLIKKIFFILFILLFFFILLFKGKEVLTYATRRVNLEDIMPSD